MPAPLNGGDVSFGIASTVMSTGEIVFQAQGDALPLLKITRGGVFLRDGDDLTCMSRSMWPYGAFRIFFEKSGCRFEPDAVMTGLGIRLISEGHAAFSVPDGSGSIVVTAGDGSNGGSPGGVQFIGMGDLIYLRMERGGRFFHDGRELGGTQVAYFWLAEWLEKMLVSLTETRHVV